MKVVSNTSPIINLAWIGKLELLHELSWLRSEPKIRLKAKSVLGLRKRMAERVPRLGGVFAGYQISSLWGILAALRSEVAGSA